MLVRLIARFDAGIGDNKRVMTRITHVVSRVVAFIEADEVAIQDDHVKPLMGLEKVDLAFDGLEMILDTKRKGEKRRLLDGSIRGRAKPGRMLAIMGPSGRCRKRCSVTPCL